MPFGPCSDCAAALPLRDPNDLVATKFECRRHPPVPCLISAPAPGGLSMAVTNLTQWPIVTGTKGCWDFVAKEE